MSLLIKNGMILIATSGFTGDLYIEGETIRQIGSNLNMDADHTVDTVDEYILLGGVDEHVHYGSFGGRLFETAETTTVGGITTVVDFALQEEDVPLLDATRQQAARAGGTSSVDFTLHVVIMDSKKPVSEEVRHLPEMGVTTLKLFMAYKGTAFHCDDKMILNAMMNAKEASVTMTVHAENVDIITILANHYLNQGETAPVYHCHARPPIVEEEATGHAVALAKATGCPLFMVHVSTKEAMETIRKAHSQGWPVFGETCTHYLTPTIDHPSQPGFKGVKCIRSPSLRPQEHVDAPRQAVREGWLIAMGSNHCTLDGGSEGARKKGTNSSNIPNGCPGVQDRLALLWTYGVRTGTAVRQKFVELSATNPAKVVGLPDKGELCIGADTDIVVFDPGWKGVITNRDNLHGIDYEPFRGFKIQGRPEQVHPRGYLVTENGVSIDEHGEERWQKCQLYGLCYDYYHK